MSYSVKPALSVGLVLFFILSFGAVGLAAATVAVRSTKTGGPPPSEGHAGFTFRFTNAKYHTEPVTDSEIVRVVLD